jgi:hypothetical protein
VNRSKAQQKTPGRTTFPFPPESESDETDGSSTNFKLELRVPAVEFRVAVAAATIAGAQVLD